MNSRRRFLFQAGSLMLASSLPLVAQPGQFWMPDEGEPHERTWMAFGASAKVWGRKLLPAVQRNLASIALAIAEFEPVSMLVRGADLELAKKLTRGRVQLVVADLNDLWMRDTGPIFVVSEERERVCLDFNFNGWGEKQEYEADAKVARVVAQAAVGYLA